MKSTIKPMRMAIIVLISPESVFTVVVRVDSVRPACWTIGRIEEDLLSEIESSGLINFRMLQQDIHDVIIVDNDRRR